MYVLLTEAKANRNYYYTASHGKGYIIAREGSNKKRGNYATKKEKVVYRQDRKSNVSSQTRKHEGNPDHKAFVFFCLFSVL